MGVPPTVLRDSNISLLCLEGNPFSQRDLYEIPEYEKVKQFYLEMFDVYICF